MSCHSIGHGINTITHKLSELYDDNQITTETFKELIRVCQDAVWLCDGNPYEAIDCIIGNDSMANRDIEPVVRCGSCLRKLENEDAYDFPYLGGKEPEFLKQFAHIYCSCLECYNKYLKQYSNEYEFEFIKVKDGRIKRQ